MSVSTINLSTLQLKNIGNSIAVQATIALIFVVGMGLLCFNFWSSAVLPLSPVGQLAGKETLTNITSRLFWGLFTVVALTGSLQSFYYSFLAVYYRKDKEMAVYCKNGFVRINQGLTGCTLLTLLMFSFNYTLIGFPF
jgi:hypothetical protein